MTRRAGFTLIELVVVIMILGILAGVAAPKFFNTSATATDNGVKQTLSIVRDAIELYNTANGSYPPCTSGAALDFKAAIKTYMRSDLPACPVGPAGIRNANVSTGSGTVAPDASPAMGWRYFSDSGSFIINTTAASANSGPAYSTF